MSKLILASNSPRRKELLSLLKIPFEIIPADIDETINPENDLNQEIERLSFQKALAIFKDNKDSIVIGSDTIVHIDNEIFGKPKDVQEAKEMLKRLSNNTHTVITAVTIISNKLSETFSINSDVTFMNLTEEEIDKYISTNEPLDKAGSYAIQGDGAKFIKHINGDYYAIIGLPISEVYDRLKKHMPM